LRITTPSNTVSTATVRAWVRAGGRVVAEELLGRDGEQRGVLDQAATVVGML
jgi:hypothetical protein